MTDFVTATIDLGKYVFGFLNVSFVLGSLGSYLIIRYRLLTSEKGAQINDHMKDIEKFSDAALTYWLRSNEKSDEDAERAARLRAMHGLLTKMYPDVSRLCASRCRRYKELMLALFDDAMGGDFEGADRKIEYARASRIGDCQANIILELRKVRTEVLTIRYVLRSMFSFRKTGT
jgi:hypothetical protein